METVFQAVTIGTIIAAVITFIFKTWGKSWIENVVRSETDKSLKRYDRYHGRISHWTEELNDLVVNVEEAMASMCDVNNDQYRFRSEGEKVLGLMHLLHKSYRKAFVYLGEDSVNAYKEIENNISLMCREATAIIFEIERPGNQNIDALIERKRKLQSNFINATTPIIERFQRCLKEDLRRGVE